MISRNKRKKTFEVSCNWCGLKIREDKYRDAKGVCLKCFYQIVSNHLRSQKKTGYGEFVSDR